MLKKQVEAQEKQRKPWNKTAHQKQDEVLKKVKAVLVTDLATALDTHFGSREDVPADLLTIITTGEKVLE